LPPKRVCDILYYSVRLGKVRTSVVIVTHHSCAASIKILILPSRDCYSWPYIKQMTCELREYTRINKLLFLNEIFTKK